MPQDHKPRWQLRAGAICAWLMALVWLVAGLWKLSDISGFQVKLSQLLVPVALTLPATLLLAVSEVFAGVLLLRPAWRRLGGYFSALLLAVFMAYVGVNYETLRGEDCSCFPWLERAVGPAFFWSDAAMLALALVAAVFAPPVRSWRGAAYALAGVLALGGTALAIDRLAPAAAADVPETLTTLQGEYPLREGKVFLYFFNPMCLHCLDAGIAMSKYEWKAQFVGIPTQDPDFADGFIEDAGLKDVIVSPELQKMKEIFPFDDVPYAVALEDGRVVEKMPFFEEPELGETLRRMGFVE